jgi:hypothetical protein
MKSKLGNKFIYGIMIFFFVTHIMVPTTVFADGDPTEEPAATSVPVDPSTPVPTDEAAPVPTDEPVLVLTDEVPLVPTEEVPALPTEATEPEETPVALPEDTNLVILDENGQPLPLATQAAADLLINGDPIWCPTGADPIPGVGGCTGAFAYFNGESGLIAALQADALLADPVYEGAGTIYISENYLAEGVDFNASILFDHSSLSNLTDLVFQGGWDPSDSNKGQDFSHNTEFNLDNYMGFGSANYSLSFQSWNHSLTLNNITLTNTSGGLDINSGECLILVDLQWVYDQNCVPNADVTLNNVIIANSGRDAIVSVANASAGAEISTSGNITVNDSSFNSNRAEGLNIYSGLGNITLNNVVANLNRYNGANLSSDYDKGVFLTGTNVFNENGSTGLAVEYSGDFYADASSHITANDNGYDGLYISNYEDTEASGSVVSLLGTNSFTGNGDSGEYGTGLEIIVDGTITLNEVLASDNYEYGAYLDNCMVDEEPDNGNCMGTGSVFMTGTNTFNENGNDGLYVITNGDITLDNINAGYYDIEGDSYYGNDEGGAELYTYNGDMLITNSVFSGNNTFGLYAETGGKYGPDFYDIEYREDRCTSGGCDITLDNVKAEFNWSDHGAMLNTFYGGDVTVTDSEFNANDFNGLQVIAGETLYDPETGRWYDDGDYWLFEGYDVISSDCLNGTCNIILENVTAGYVDFENDDWYGNGWDGVDLWTEEGTISVSNSDFTGNDDYGLNAWAGFGDVVVENTTAEYNGYGADLGNDYGGDITVTDSFFNDNYYTALEVHAAYEDECNSDYTCNITLSNVEANGDSEAYDIQEAGADLWTYFGTINISDSFFNENYEYGVSAVTVLGDIIIDSITANNNNNGNEENAAYFATISSGSVSITDSEFNYNGGEYDGYAGLYVVTVAKGSSCEDGFSCDITLDGVHADGNIDNSGAVLNSMGKISINDSSFSENDWNGLSIQNGESEDGLPSIYMDNVTASENGGNGFIFNDPESSFNSTYGPADIVVDCSNFKGNYYYGLNIENSGGTYTLEANTTGNNIDGSDGLQNHLVPDGFVGSCEIVDAPPSETEVAPKSQTLGYEEFVSSQGEPKDIVCSYLGLDLFTQDEQGDFVRIPCVARGTGSQATALDLDLSALPAVPTGTFISALKFTIQDGSEADAQNLGMVTVAFKLPDGGSAESYSILFWNGTLWETVSNSYLEDGYFKANVNQTGTYVLVKN